jgi:hypothetical protein
MELPIRRSARYHLWTVYWRGRGVAGLTHPSGVFIGGLVVAWVQGHLIALYRGRQLLPLRRR